MRFKRFETSHIPLNLGISKNVSLYGLRIALKSVLNIFKEKLVIEKRLGFLSPYIILG